MKTKRMYTKFKKWEEVYADANMVDDIRHADMLTVVKQSPNRMFTTVRTKDGHEYEIFTNRLTKYKS